MHACTLLLYAARPAAASIDTSVQAILRTARAGWQVHGARPVWHAAARTHSLAAWHFFSWGRSELKHAQFQKPGSYLQGRAWCRRISRASTLRFWDWLRGRTACVCPIADPSDPSAEYTSVEALSGVRNAQPLWGQDRAMSLGAEAKTGETVCTRSRERAPEKKRKKKKYSARVPDMGEIIDS